MKSFSTLSSLYQTLTNNSETANATLGTELINDGVRDILGMPVSWKFLEDSLVVATTTSSVYNKPYNVDTILGIKRESGSDQYILKQVKSRDEWNILTETSLTSDFTSHYYLNANTIDIYPTPATAGDDLTFYYKKRAVDLGTADYTTGTLTVTNDSTAVVGGGTAFTQLMVGRYLKVSTDGQWYRISSVTDGTNLTLQSKYQGVTGAGLAFTIGQMSVLPENFHKLPVYYAVAEYFSQNDADRRAREYERKYKEGVKQLKDWNISSTMDIGLDDGVIRYNPNFYPQSLT
jgi:hypothetical protein